MGPGPGALKRRDRHRVERAGREDSAEEDGRPFPVPGALRRRGWHRMNRSGGMTMLKSTGEPARVVVLESVQVGQQEKL